MGLEFNSKPIVKNFRVDILSHTGDNNIMKKVEFYTKLNGKQPVQEYFDTLDPVTFARIDQRIQRARRGNYGNHTVLKAGNGVIELKFTFGKGYRVYFAEDEDILILLLNAGDKSNYKKDIKNAIEYWSDYLSRKNK